MRELTPDLLPAPIPRETLLVVVVVVVVVVLRLFGGEEASINLLVSEVDSK